MATITEKENGTYLVRVFCGRDNNGKQIFKSRTFRPSKRNLPYHKLTSELNNFVKAFEDELREKVINNEFTRMDDPSKMPFAAIHCAKVIYHKYGFSPTNLYRGD